MTVQTLDQIERIKRSPQNLATKQFVSVAVFK